ncbi:MAG TPA: hypothetical protein VGN72_23790 [Tepidisphaeraceae bacterium]|jgi:hypothetical protein|nr:hypothetical protein [Tepidisphaeraceae bacterium]
MILLSPLWLLALLPWTALAVWSLVQRGRTVAVPFVQLWQTSATPTPRRGWRAPPSALLLMLGSILLAILAAAGPATRGAAPVTVIIDRGATMSVELRYRLAGAAALRELADREFAARIVPVPATATVWNESLNDLPPTAVDTRVALHAAIAQAIGAGESVVVVSDRDLPASPGGRIFRAAVAPSTGGVSITHLAATTTPANQVMVRLRNESEATIADLTLATGGTTRTTRVDLPSASERRDYFIDVDSLGTNIAVSVGIGPGQQAYLSRQSAAPIVEAVGLLPPAIARVIAAYTVARPPEVTVSQRVLVTTDAPPTGPAIFVGQGPAVRAAAPFVVVDHPLTRLIDWPAMAVSATLSGDPPAGYRVLVSDAGGRPVLAIDEAASRAWISLQLPASEQSIDWIILWTRLFEHVGAAGGAGGETFTAASPHVLGSGWRPLNEDPFATVEPGLWPGLFQHADGRLIAINPPDVQPRAAAASPGWPAQLSIVQARLGGTSLAPVLLLLALICLIAAGALVGRRSGLFQSTAR